MEEGDESSKHPEFDDSPTVIRADEPPFPYGPELKAARMNEVPAAIFVFQTFHQLLLYHDTMEHTHRSGFTDRGKFKDLALGDNTQDSNWRYGSFIPVNLDGVTLTDRRFIQVEPACQLNMTG